MTQNVVENPTVRVNVAVLDMPEDQALDRIQLERSARDQRRRVSTVNISWISLRDTILTIINVVRRRLFADCVRASRLDELTSAVRLGKLSLPCTQSCTERPCVT